MEKRGGGTVGARGMEEIRRVRPLELTNLDSWGLRVTEGTISDPARVSTGSSVYSLWLLVWCFGGQLDSRVEVSLTLYLSALGTVFLL